MTRAEHYPQVKALRAEGLLLREIGERLGISKTYVSSILRDPTGGVDRERKRRYEHPCTDCGKPVNPNGLELGSGRCRRCNEARTRAQTRQWILESFREWEELFGEPPSATDWSPAMARNNGREDKVARHTSTGRRWPYPATVLDHFGTWNAGRAAAGFAVNATGTYGREGEKPSVIAETVALYRSGLSGPQIGERMGCTSATVYYRLEKAGEPRRSAYPRQRGVAA